MPKVHYVHEQLTNIESYKSYYVSVYGMVCMYECMYICMYVMVIISNSGLLLFFFTAELDCLVTAIAINHQTIRCLVGCSTTAPINITTTLPSPSTSSCEANQGES